MSKPVIRLIQQLPRVGGTLLAKCMAAQPNVVLLSEIHPLSQIHNPLQQAQQWYRLFGETQLASFAQQDQLTYLDIIDHIHQACVAQNKILVIRDWSHWDFIGHPFHQAPSGQSLHYSHLQERYQVLRVSLVRHPLDQWTSLQTLQSTAGNIPVEIFCNGISQFAQWATTEDWVRYEDFCQHPAEHTQAFCQSLKIPFDPAAMEQWQDVTTVTGDIFSDPSRDKSRIQPMPRRELAQQWQSQLEDNPHYQDALALMGYTTGETA